MADPDEALTASAAEVEAAQRAMGCRQGPTVYDDSTPEYALCLSDVHVHALFMGECEFARLVADAVVAAAQPRTAAEAPVEALIEATALAIGNADGQAWESLDDAPSRAAFMGYPEMARAAYAALVEHLGLVEERDYRRRLLVGHAAHEAEYSHACPACNPLPHEQVWFQRRRLVSRWTEVDHGSE